MATKFTNDEARFFNRLVKGEDFTTLFKEYENEINARRWLGDPKKGEEYKRREIEDLINVKAFFDKCKLFDKPELYMVNPWGYDQTNYDNLSVLGQNGGVMVCMIEGKNYGVYTIAKAKYTKKECANIDTRGVRSTNWRESYTTDEIMNNVIYNAYNGH